MIGLIDEFKRWLCGQLDDAPAGELKIEPLPDHIARNEVFPLQSKGWRIC